MSPNSEKSLQETYASSSTCYGCGPSNPQGLRIRSFVTGDGDEVVAEWQPQPHHEAYPGALNGGIIGTLLDCHSNWAATWHLMQKQGEDHPPATVTAEYCVRFRKPTPTDEPVRLVARVVESKDDRAVVESQIIAKGEVTATFRGTFVAVRPGHPAYHRWE
jgi:acyl-coenzyme A thioesterase PaaI-like protein